MGAFNEWVKNTVLDAPQNRTVVSVALNIMYGAALVTRINMLRYQGARISPEEINMEPMDEEKLGVGFEY